MPSSRSSRRSPCSSRAARSSRPRSASGAIVQGYNFLIPAKDVAKFLQGTEVTKPGDSKFNPVWAAGIDLLLAQRYHAAAAKIAEANKLLPNLTDVKRALAEAQE